MNKLKLVLSACVLAIATLATQAQGYKPGDAATDFKLKNVDGKMVSLADLNLSANCSPCWAVFLKRDLFSVTLKLQYTPLLWQLI